MRLRTTVLTAVLGMALACAIATRLPLPSDRMPIAARGDVSDAGASTSSAGASFGADGQEGPVTIDGRLGNATLAKGSDGETYLLVNVHGADARADAAVTPPVHLAVVVDRSGSMRGARIDNAIAAATGLVERLRPHDSVSVVSFDTQSQVVVPPTEIDDSTRPAVVRALRTITVGGDTCISCGLEEGMHQLRERDETAGPGGGSNTSGEVRRMVLLSDGVTNHGIRDLPGLRALAGRLRDSGCAVSTVGLDVDFDEKVMGAIANESNGNHYFVRDASNLSSIFQSELEAVESTVANDVDLDVDVAPGVQVEEVLDRAFTRGSGPNGARVTIPFGTLRSNQDKTLIARVHVAADRTGAEPVAKLTLRYRDVGAERDREATAVLAVTIGDTTASMDPLVSVRLDRSTTAATLLQANDLFVSGRVDEAKHVLEHQRASVEKRKADVATFAPRRGLGSEQLDDANKDLARQESALAKATTAFSPSPAATAAPGGPFAAPAPKPSSREGKSSVKENQAAAGPMKF